MKVVAINGSPRIDGNTASGLKIMTSVLESQGIQTEFVQLGGNTYSGCRACGGCKKLQNKHCTIITDGMNDVLDKIFEADGIIIGSPTYFSNVTTEVKALIDRCGYVSGANGGLLKRKVGASVIPVRRAGSNFVYAAINFFYGISEMTIATSSYWNMTVAREKGEILNDEEGVRTFETLANNMAWLLKTTRENAE